MLRAQDPPQAPTRAGHQPDAVTSDTHPKQGYDFDDFVDLLFEEISVSMERQIRAQCAMYESMRVLCSKF